jgi:arsenate reductase
MAKVTVYEYSKCGTCRNAVKWLKGHGLEVESVPLFEHPPGKEELRKLIRQSDLDIRKFFNTSGEAYKEMKLKDKLPQMNEEEMLELLSSNGRLLKRPIVSDGSKATIGFKEERFAEVWGPQGNNGR